MANIGPHDSSPKIQGSSQPEDTQQPEKGLNKSESDSLITRASTLSNAILHNPVTASSPSGKAEEKETQRDFHYSADTKGPSIPKIDNAADTRLKRQRSSSTNEKRVVKEGYVSSSTASKRGRPLSQEIRKKQSPSTRKQSLGPKKTEKEGEEEEAEMELPVERTKAFKPQKLFTLFGEREREVIMNGREFIPEFVKVLSESKEFLSIQLSRLITEMDNYNNRMDKTGEIMPELIQMHAQARLLLYFHMAVIYWGSKCEVDWVPAQKQLYTGSELSETEACHHSLFAEMNDTYLFQLKQELIQAIRNKREDRREEIPSVLLDKLEEVNLPRKRITDLAEMIISEKKSIEGEIQNIWAQTFPLSASIQGIKEELRNILKSNGAAIPAELSRELKKIGIPNTALRNLTQAIRERKTPVNRGVDLLFDQWALPALLNPKTQFYYLNHHTLVAPSALNRVDDFIENQVRVEAIKTLRKISHLELSPISGTLEVGRRIEKQLRDCLELSKEKTFLVGKLEKDLGELARLIDSFQTPSQLPFFRKMDDLMRVKSIVEGVQPDLERLKFIHSSSSIVHLMDPTEELDAINTMSENLQSIHIILASIIPEEIEEAYKTYKESPFFHAYEKIKKLKSQIKQNIQKKSGITGILEETKLTRSEEMIKMRVEDALQIDLGHLISDKKFDKVEELRNELETKDPEIYGEVKALLKDEEYSIFWDVVFKMTSKEQLEKEKKNLEGEEIDAKQRISELRNLKEPDPSNLKSEYSAIVESILAPNPQKAFEKVLKGYPIPYQKLALTQNILSAQLNATVNLIEQLKPSDLELLNRHMYEYRSLSKLLLRSVDSVVTK
ncbi:hypothetical protein [Parachlamydia sp. AcF125]|uniref:hypothetical protein n=1 Tax=Parachlamydia sp. AcF125 TaxID=2795736 RepID=UPI001BC9C8BD|nr:hypothetical protein [Parachlamydia sp. AcF125]MBS4168400.1 hypothetical protein [Parachlamydia sp. AcF125]